MSRQYYGSPQHQQDSAEASAFYGEPMDDVAEDAAIAKERAQLLRLREVLFDSISHQLAFKAPGALSEEIIADLANNLAQALLGELNGGGK